MSLPLAQIIAARRDVVIKSYEAAKAENARNYNERLDDKATSEYIYPNQMQDATCIVNAFYNDNVRAVSIQKKTKVGADGLMIELAKLMATHIDDNFVVNPDNIRIITGMSNAIWEKDMKDKAPTFLKNKIFHHGKLSKSELSNIKNAFIMIDEIDNGDKEYQILHQTLKEAGILDVTHMNQHNNRFVFISATMIRELHDLYKWGNLHKSFKMNIPQSYIGHCDFLDLGIIQEFYSLNTLDKALLWIQTDILDRYNNNFRVHIVRVNKKNCTVISNACNTKGLIFRNHNSTDRLTEAEIDEFFNNPLTNHIVLAVNGFFRRANLIPNDWKLRIGATHELYTKKVDNNVQIQGLPGRMTGYWRNYIEGGHLTGPYRTSIKAIKEYEKNYNNPYGCNSYQTSGFKKESGRVSAGTTMLSPKHIKNLTAIELPIIRQPCSRPITIIPINDTEKSKFKIDKDAIVNIIRTRIPAIYDDYQSYKTHFWKIDTPNKCEKYGLHKMMETNAYSSETNVRKNEKDKNILMIYLHNNNLIISPWAGSEKALEASATVDNAN